MLDVDHCSRVFKSSCSLLLLAIRLNNFVSSAKVAIVDEHTASGRSLTYKRCDLIRISLVLLKQYKVEKWVSSFERVQ